MALVTRENSGLTCTVDGKGCMALHLDGKRIPGVVSLQTDTTPMQRGTMTITVLTQFVTFEQDANDIEAQGDERAAEAAAIRS